MNVFFASLLASAILALSASTSHAQFGKNKVQYKNYQWNVVSTQHFDIYSYQGEEEAAMRAARMAERAYVRLSRILRHEIKEKVPIILYASHTDFQQTNISPGLIPEGVGGITEYTKRRVYLPFTGSYGEFDHVLTHELVHAFQIDVLFGSGADANPFAFQPPLWFMEGMAEYLSLGGVDPHTDMWLRWSALDGNLIPLYVMDQVWDIRVYRIGQAIFAFLGERYGDEKIGELLRLTAYHRSIDAAFEKALGVDRRVLSDEWEDYVKRKYFPQITELERPESVARPLSRRGEFGMGGQIQLAPSLSPDGSRLVYIENGEFSTNIVLASAIDGKVLGRLIEGERSADFESLRYMYTSIGWSPDGTRIAFPSKRGGEDVLNVMDVDSKEILRTYSFQLDGLTSPSFHPRGDRVIFAGVHGGETDLYVVELVSGNIEKITEGPYFERDPQWSPDGTKLAFVTDLGPQTNLEVLQFGESRIAVMDNATREITLLPDQEGKNISPQWGPDGKTIAFVSDRDGISNLYVQEIDTAKIHRLTKLITGVTGIIDSSPPFSWSRNGRRIVFTTFQGEGWDLYEIEEPLDAMIEIDKPEPLDRVADREIARSFPPRDPEQVAVVTPSSEAAGSGNRDGRSTGVGGTNGSGGLHADAGTNGKGTNGGDSAAGDPGAGAPAPGATNGHTQPSDLGAPAGSDTGTTGDGTTPVDGTPVEEATTSPYAGILADLGTPPHGLSILAPTTAGIPEHGIPEVGAVADSAYAEDRVVLAELRAQTVRDLPDVSTFEKKPYKLKWAPDYLAATPMFASNVGFAGQAVISFSDMLSNHILQFGASVYGSISDSDLIFSYYNLARRTNWGVTLYQYRNDFGVYTAPDRVGFESQIYRGVQGSISRPFSKFSRLEFQARAVAVSARVFQESFVSGGFVSAEEIDSDYIYYAEPGIALVLDQVVYGYEGPRHGRRGRLSLDQAFGDIQATTIVGDFRRYFAWGRNVVFATRFIGGSSMGKTPRIFRIGGASTLRGVDYGELEGDRIGLMNLELRFPLLSNLALGWPLRVGLGGIGGVLFFDFGGAWGHAPRFFADGALDDVTAGYGFGARLGLGYFALKYDWAQETDLRHSRNDSISYFTIGVDF